MKKIALWFIPNKKNKFHPQALRPAGLIIFLIIYLSLPPIYNATAYNKFQVLGYASNISISELHSISNQKRSAYGAPALALNSQLNSAAAAKASDMIKQDYWAHTSPDGKTPWYFIANSGYSYSTAAENLANGFDTSQWVVNGWMNSSTHKANLVNKEYRDVGYAVLNGVLQGTETTLVVAMYAAKPKATAPTPAPTTKAAPGKSSAVPAKAAQKPSEAKEVAVADSRTEAKAKPIEDKPVVKGDDIKEQITHPIDSTQTTVNLNPNPDSKSFLAVAGVFTTSSIQKYSSFNWSQRVSILLLCSLILLFLLKHTLIWRQQKRGIRHIWLRSHPLGQAALLFTVLILTLASSAGAVL